MLTAGFAAGFAVDVVALAVVLAEVFDVRGFVVAVWVVAWVDAAGVVLVVDCAWAGLGTLTRQTSPVSASTQQPRNTLCTLPSRRAEPIELIWSGVNDRARSVARILAL